MRRPLALALALLLLAAAPAAADAAPRLRATLATCAPGVAEFRAAMPAIPGSVRLAMRFDLQSRAPDGGLWQRVVAPGFGTWIRSEPRRAGLVYAKRVEGLGAPMAYRSVVRFRWLGEEGEVLRSARRTTRACEQDDPRPDLAAGRLTALPGPDEATLRYRLVVRNEGAADAGPFAVALDVGEGARAEVAGVRAGRAATVELVAPRCGGQVGVHLDADGVVAESDEADNLVPRPCPSVQAS
jgi:hypothetical protein